MGLGWGPWFWAVALALVLFGVAYNALTAWAERQPHGQAYTAFLVVGGVAVTLAALAAVAGIQPALMAAALFAASGLPMIIGSMLRYLDRQAEELARTQGAARRVLEADDGNAGES